jgi:superkiller protein 3
VSQLQRATALLEAEYEIAESSEVEAAYAVALSNLGRVQLAAGGYDAALEAYNGCIGLVDERSDKEALLLKTHCRFGAGLAHYWLGQVDEALDAFQASLAEAEGLEPEVKDEVSVMLARTLWGVGGEDAKEAAKSHLLEW